MATCMMKYRWTSDEVEEEATKMLRERVAGGAIQAAMAGVECSIKVNYTTAAEKLTKQYLESIGLSRVDFDITNTEQENGYYFVNVAVTALD